MTTIADPGEKSLAKLLATLTTTLHPGVYVFTTFGPDTTAPLPPFSEMQMLFKETEGTTAIVSKAYAEANNIEYFFPCEMLTCEVTSSLDAVGFMAVIATRLAEKAKMGVNPVSGFYHDHLFVPEGRGQETQTLLAELAKEYQIKSA